VFKAYRLLYHSTLGLRVIKKKTRQSNKEEEKPANTAEIKGIS